MTPDQRKMARHALGLGDGRKISYRNYYVVAAGTTQEAAWDDLVNQGLALRQEKPRLSFVGFCLTEIGAEEALEPDEQLDLEDFPI